MEGEQLLIILGKLIRTIMMGREQLSMLGLEGEYLVVTNINLCKVVFVELSR